MPLGECRLRWFAELQTNLIAARLTGD
jgi:hypothetical protein